MTQQQTKDITEAIVHAFVGTNAVGGDVNVGDAIKYVGLQLGKVADALDKIATAISKQ